jgi:hypothetical protein
MEQSVEKIIERNLLEVFNGRDADSRRAAIDELWDKDGLFIDPGGVHEGVEKINKGEDDHPDLWGFGDGKRAFFWIKQGMPESASPASSSACRDQRFFAG